MYRMRATAWPGITTRKEETFFCRELLPAARRRVLSSGRGHFRSWQTKRLPGNRRLPDEAPATQAAAWRRGPAGLLLPAPLLPPLPFPGGCEPPIRAANSLQMLERSGPLTGAPPPSPTPRPGPTAAPLPAQQPIHPQPGPGEELRSSWSQGTFRGAGLPRDQVYLLCPFTSVFS